MIQNANQQLAEQSTCLNEVAQKNLRLGFGIEVGEKISDGKIVFVMLGVLCSMIYYEAETTFINLYTI